METVPDAKRVRVEEARVLVTGGTGLVGRALADVLSQEPRPHEEWIFLSSKDGDLRCVHRCT